MINIEYAMTSQVRELDSLYFVEIKSRHAIDCYLCHARRRHVTAAASFGTTARRQRLIESHSHCSSSHRISSSCSCNLGVLKAIITLHYAAGHRVSLCVSALVVNAIQFPPPAHPRFAAALIVSCAATGAAAVNSLIGTLARRPAPRN